MKTSTSFNKIEARSTYGGSCKKYFTGSRRDLNVPYREVRLSATQHSDRLEQNAPVPLYDTSGSYTDPSLKSISLVDFRSCARHGLGTGKTLRNSSGRALSLRVYARMIC